MAKLGHTYMAAETVETTLVSSRFSDIQQQKKTLFLVVSKRKRPETALISVRSINFIIESGGRGSELDGGREILVRWGPGGKALGDERYTG